MTLISIGSYLRQARMEGYAIPLFDAFDSLSAEGIFQAFEELQAPGIIAVYSPLLDQSGGSALTAYIRTRAENSSAPISLMLDHGGSFEHCMRAIQLGFTDIMFDGSRLSLEENITITRSVVRAAHACGLCAEAELGHVGLGSDYQQIDANRAGFTDPDLVGRFVSETDVDFLAVAIGNAHGLYQGEPHLDLNLLEKIRDQIEIPLVLHGGTGIHEDDFRAVIKRGISKINIATDLYLQAVQQISTAIQAGESSYFKLADRIVNAIRERCLYYIQLFRSNLSLTGQG